MNIFRSIAAILAGMIVGIALSLVTDLFVHKIGFFASPGGQAESGPLLVATAYRTVYGVIGAYVAARLAPARPMLHALTLGFLGFLVSIFGAAYTWNRGAEYGAHWYPVALVVLALPTAWLGGWLRERQLH